jgi:23S rRNA (uracil1939-C5)-methyltransferase
LTELIVRLAARGDGATEKGRFVAGAVPGDSVDDAGVISRGPNYVDPACKHFGRCGGCQLQHVGDAVYRDYVTDRIKEGLRAQGIEAPDFRPVHLSPALSRRRVSLRVFRQGKRITLGFAEAGSHKLVDLAQCPVMHPELFALIAPLRTLLAQMLRDRRQGDIRMTRVDGGVDVLISGIEVDGLAATEALTAFAQQNKLARLSIDEGYGPTPRWEPDPATITLSGVRVPMPEGAFLQATADGEACLVDAVKSALGAAPAVVDLFAGLGTFSFALPGVVHAAEGARDAILSLQMAAKRAGRAIATEHRDLFRRPVTAKELAQFDGIVIDPPRAGAREQVIEIAASTVPRIAFVSCNPATFARDAKTLIDGGYQLDWIQPVGQFRWSTHVELAAAFSR